MEPTATASYDSSLPPVFSLAAFSEIGETNPNGAGNNSSAAKRSHSQNRTPLPETRVWGPAPENETTVSPPAWLSSTRRWGSEYFYDKTPVGRLVGLDYAVNRLYSSMFGRFTSPDPYQASGGPGDPESWNRYPYVKGDPVGFFDPAGLQARAPVPGYCSAEFSYEDCGGDPLFWDGGVGGGGGGGDGDRFGDGYAIAQQQGYVPGMPADMWVSLQQYNQTVLANWMISNPGAMTWPGWGPWVITIPNVNPFYILLAALLIQDGSSPSSGRWHCAATCNVQCQAGCPLQIDRISGEGWGPDEAIASNNAQVAANNNLAQAMARAYAAVGGRKPGDPGCYKRHCQSRCEKR